MAKYIGESPGETYYHTPDGKWTHAQANGKSWDNLEDAENHYRSLHADNGSLGCLFLIGILISCLILTYIQ